MNTWHFSVGSSDKAELIEEFKTVARAHEFAGCPTESVVAAANKLLLTIPNGMPMRATCSGDFDSEDRIYVNVEIAAMKNSGT